MTELYVANTDCLKNKELFDACYAMLPSFRKEKVDRLQSIEKKVLSMGAFLLLVDALRKRGISPEEIEFSYNANGKPTLTHFPNVHFSVSHSGNTVFCAVSDAAVGCDVERIRRIDLNIISRFFSPREQAQIEAQPTQADKEKMFFRLWTLKESFIKMTGQTLSQLKDFSVIIQEDGTRLDPNKNFYLQEFSLGDNYCYACCSEVPDISPPVTINLEDIKRP
ncbi:MAG: 4'-phosphopantetheinyl transferase superfamily protein [Ruminococcaceae bacterium]|nr:4'-phosphopantetheinyl transferase superfamily protein [Oscillospiraceae bacterium]